MAGSMTDFLKNALDNAIKNPMGALNTVNMATGVLKNAATHPEAALSGFLLSLAGIMGHELSVIEANTLARMAVRTIMKGKRV